MKPNQNDALQILIDDHNAVKELFAQFGRLPDSSRAQKKQLSYQICQALNLHFEIEEKVFYPAAKKAIDDDDLIMQALVDHARAKELIAEIEDMDLDDEMYDATLDALAEQIDSHVDEEEEDMFPMLRDTNLNLVALGERMAQYRQRNEAASPA